MPLNKETKLQNTNNFENRENFEKTTEIRFCILLENKKKTNVLDLHYNKPVQQVL